MLECVANVSEGRDEAVLAALSDAAGEQLLDLHADADHHRSVLTIASPSPAATVAAVRRLADAVARLVDLREHAGVHPRFGALDVVPFVALAGTAATDAVAAARDFAWWWAEEHGVPVFLYDAADPHGRPLPDARHRAFTERPPDLGPGEPHPELGATAVGVRPPLGAVNCVLHTGDVALARRIAATVRERDGGLPGVRALGFFLESRRRAQVSMNLVDLDATGVEEACTRVRELAREAHTDVESVEVVGLLPAAEVERWSERFRGWAGLDDVTIEGRLARRTTGPSSPGG